MPDLAEHFGRVDATDRLTDPASIELLASLSVLLERLQPPGLERARSSVIVDDQSVFISLEHIARPSRRLEVSMFGSEAVVSYGEEHEHFRADHQDTPEQIGPFRTPGMVPKVIAFLDALMTGRIELDVWTRPLYVRTRSYWINDAGERELFLRGGTVGLGFGWSGPHLRTFSFL